jgi:hypothetical protein
MALDDLLRKIREKTEKAKKLTEEESVPLTGGSATEFTDDTNEAKSAAADAQDDSAFNGMTPALRSGPPAIEGGPDYPPWLHDLAVEADQKGPNFGSQQDKQDCLDCCYTIEQKAQDSIDECT